MEKFTEIKEKQILNKLKGLNSLKYILNISNFPHNQQNYNRKKNFFTNQCLKSLK
jgi:hypothetical protein